MAEWISVKERLPEPGCSVIVSDGCGVFTAWLRRRVTERQKKWSTMTRVFDGVTHWMPLPDPPKEEK